jgi:hypothetical protein
MAWKRKKIDDAYAVELVLAELRSARGKFPRPFNTPHEGFAVLKEEVDELWETVRGLEGDMRKEAVQVAAMALRFLVEST